MPSATVNNQTAPDTYPASPSPLIVSGLPTLDHININVANQGIYFQLEQYSPATSDRAGNWQQETFMPPGSVTLTRQFCTGIRFRAAVPAAQLPANNIQAQVSIEAVYY